MRDYISIYINGEPRQIKGDHAFMTLSDYLRYERGLVGTKVVCAEGDCGACTVLIGNARSLKDGDFEYVPVNSCISFMHILDGCHIVTVEGLKNGDELNEVQKSMVDNHGAQCGFCTPGFVCALNAGAEASASSGKKFTEKKVKNALTGNLCRCTGYKSIIEAGLNIDMAKFEPLTSKYDSAEILKNLRSDIAKATRVKSETNEVYLPTKLSDAIEHVRGDDCVLISGASDLGVLYNKRGYDPSSLLGLHNIEEMNQIIKGEGEVFIGARVNLHKIEQELRDELYEFTHMIHIFASPQIKNRATLVGNIANASPIGDSIPFLMVMNAKIILIGSQGERVVNINDFYQGYKKLDMKDDEFIKGVSIPLLDEGEKVKLYKTSNRKDMDISIVTFASKFKVNEDKIEDIQIAVGGVGPVVMRVEQTENELKGKTFNKSAFESASMILKKEVTPIDDVRGTANFRRILSKNMLLKFYAEESLNISRGGK
ncbi:putative xanthine dehydrogenase [Halobacteriovorax marinus SJ]|uniref:Xanthine dehydrogenase n=1 Tax=Halobacteriovorax marinus (strain ATCC BAA-682 / DSM 15412 / SJ) TaxID=862908 RepID=E1WY76_HALMS|nr:FAD binding domain-containing protein [Halobacteriovorax marinus]CBW27631.1 putative xanthine dehydrogenase [Halobacteriovorax marinus SJ]